MGIATKNVGKAIEDPPTQILTGISIDVQDGDFVALTGRSGSGKSTLLYLLSSLDKASEGTIEIDGRNIAEYDEEEICRFRNEKVGFIFQFHYLLAELTALENVLMPARKAGQERARQSRAESLLERFGLADKRGRLPRQLSGGEQQRVAIARALVMEPKYLFADEPTGSLDTANGEIVMKILQESNRELGMTVVLVTHEPEYAKLARKQIHLVDGRVVH